MPRKIKPKKEKKPKIKRTATKKFKAQGATVTPFKTVFVPIRDGKPCWTCENIGNRLGSGYTVPYNAVSTATVGYNPLSNPLLSTATVGYNPLGVSLPSEPKKASVGVQAEPKKASVGSQASEPKKISVEYKPYIPASDFEMGRIYREKPEEFTYNLPTAVSTKYEPPSLSLKPIAAVTPITPYFVNPSPLEVEGAYLTEAEAATVKPKRKYVKKTPEEKEAERIKKEQREQKKQLKLQKQEEDI